MSHWTKLSKYCYVGLLFVLCACASHKPETIEQVTRDLKKSYERLHRVRLALEAKEAMLAAEEMP